MVNIKEIRSAPLRVVTGIMLAAFAASVAGMIFDGRVIAGAPAWLKPAKFAISSAIYAATIAWLMRYIRVWPRFVRALGWAIALVLVVEVGIVDVQAARGTTSHFNVGTPLDLALFAVMGNAIVILWLSSIGVLVALFRQKFENATWGWALRMGMLVTVLGSAMGGMMTTMTAEQVAAKRAKQPVTVVGAHTVGAPDGGPGLPGVGWSADHGDLRIAHFFGLHGAQIVPFLVWLLMQRRGDPPAGAVFAIAASYLGLIAILAWQALRGQSIAAPDGVTLRAMGIWISATALSLSALLRGAGRSVEVTL